MLSWHELESQTEKKFFLETYKNLAHNLYQSKQTIER